MGGGGGVGFGGVRVDVNICQIGGVELGGCLGGCEWKSEAFVKIKKKNTNTRTLQKKH